MIKTGRYGRVSYEPTGTGTVVPILSINGWKGDFKTDRIDVTCFQDENRVYVPGMKDISGSLTGFWNSEDITLFVAADAETPGLLELTPNTTDTVGTAPGVVPSWSGLAYFDASIDCTVDGAPAVSGTFSAAGPWTNSLAEVAILLREQRQARPAA